jgi:hypothetical protein
MPLRNTRLHQLKGIRRRSAGTTANHVFPNFSVRSQKSLDKK